MKRRYLVTGLPRSQARWPPSDSAGPLNQQHPLGQGFTALAFFCAPGMGPLLWVHGDVRNREMAVLRMLPHAGADCGNSTQAGSDQIGSTSNFRVRPSERVA